MSDLFFGTELLGEFDRLHRQMVSAFAGFPASPRATCSKTFSPVSIGSTDDSVEIATFAPGLDPAAIDVSIDKGGLTISGERKPPEPERREGTSVAIMRVRRSERTVADWHQPRCARHSASADEAHREPVKYAIRAINGGRRDDTGSPARFFA
ncbi:Hsp20/alpha crystallin family protein [Burkholderia pyrrocinia]|uniref:Hsp20/alpha crystallin family protein n=1 Tax=Burkholderia pyrrocinia TaxID=60550 RepID=UPI0030CB5791